MTAILADLSGMNWASIAAFVVGAAGLIFGWARHKSAQTTEAKAEQKVIAKDAEVAVANAKIAQASAASAANAVQAQQTAQATPASELDAALKAQGALRE